HRHALREKECGEKVADLPLPQGLDGGIVGGTLRSAVPRGVVVGAVPVLLVVSLVMLLVVGDEVGERESVVRRDKVDAGAGPPAALLVQITGAGQSIRQLGRLPIVPLPVAADAV